MLDIQDCRYFRRELADFWQIFGFGVPTRVDIKAPHSKHDLTFGHCSLGVVLSTVEKTSLT